MKIKIIDNLLDNFLIKYLHNKFLHNTPHIYRGRSISNNPNFYISHLNLSDSIIEYIFLKLTNKILKIKCNILRIYLNIQHKEMNGDFHKDDGDITLLLMITDNPKEGGGEFEYIDENNQLQKIDYKQNRLIIFDGNIEHRGLAYKGNEPRITLAYKLNYDNTSNSPKR